MSISIAATEQVYAPSVQPHWSKGPLFYHQAEQCLSKFISNKQSNHSSSLKRPCIHTMCVSPRKISLESSTRHRYWHILLLFLVFILHKYYVEWVKQNRAKKGQLKKSQPQCVTQVCVSYKSPNLKRTGTDAMSASFLKH